MKRKQILLVVAVLAALFAWRGNGVAAESEEISRMTKEELRPLLGNPEVAILDVRIGGRNSPRKIVGAVYEDPEKVDDWFFRYSEEKRIVLYCS